MPYEVLNEEMCARSRYQGLGQVITPQGICGMCLHQPYLLHNEQIHIFGKIDHIIIQITISDDINHNCILNAKQ